MLSSIKCQAINMIRISLKGVELSDVLIYDIFHLVLVQLYDDLYNDK